MDSTKANNPACPVAPPLAEQQRQSAVSPDSGHVAKTPAAAAVMWRVSMRSAYANCGPIFFVTKSVFTLLTSFLSTLPLLIAMALL